MTAETHSAIPKQIKVMIVGISIGTIAILALLSVNAGEYQGPPFENWQDAKGQSIPTGDCELIVDPFDLPPQIVTASFPKLKPGLMIFILNHPKPGIATEAEMGRDTVDKPYARASNPNLNVFPLQKEKVAWKEFLAEFKGKQIVIQNPSTYTRDVYLPLNRSEIEDFTGYAMFMGTDARFSQQLVLRFRKGIIIHRSKYKWEHGM